MYNKTYKVSLDNISTVWSTVARNIDHRSHEVHNLHIFFISFRHVLEWLNQYRLNYKNQFELNYPQLRYSSPNFKCKNILSEREIGMVIALSGQDERQWHIVPVINRSCKAEKKTFFWLRKKYV